MRPFAAALASHGITYWLDEAEITWGDRITEKINEGLAKARYVVVFLTETFLRRHWPQTELGSALNLEASTGGVVVLPVMIAPTDAVLAQYPLLRDKHYLRWEDGVDSLVRTLRQKLGLEYKPRWIWCHPAEYSGQVWIQVISDPSNREVIHHYSITWGPWECSGRLTFREQPSAVLVHAKGNDGLSIPIVFSISPTCSVRFGQGDPPLGPLHDINRGWDFVGDGPLRHGDEWWPGASGQKWPVRIVHFSVTAHPAQVRFDPRAVADAVREWSRSSRGAVILLLRGLPRTEIQEFLRFSRRRMGRTITRFQRRYGELKRAQGNATA